MTTVAEVLGTDVPYQHFYPERALLEAVPGGHADEVIDLARTSLVH